MSRMLLGLAGVVLLSCTLAADEPALQARRRLNLEEKLRVLLKDHGADHPSVQEVKERLAALKARAGARRDDGVPKGKLLVTTRSKISTTLKDAQVRALGGREFLVGVEVETAGLTRPSFEGRTVWIPVEDVTELVEMAERKAEAK